jgi:cytochrome c553
MKARALLVIAIGAAACVVEDPVHERRVEALGGETTGGPSAFHRAGQSCTVCHGDDGPAERAFSVAGTVFAGKDVLVGVENAKIDLVDAKGTSPTSPVTTNCVGNFFVARDAWDPKFPVQVRISKGDAMRPMKSAIHRAGACADCHEAKSPPSDPLANAGAVFLFDGDEPGGPSRACPVEPDLRRR